MPDVYRPQDPDVADTHVLRRVPTCDNPGHAGCLATGARNRPGAHRMRNRPRRHPRGPEQSQRVPLWRRTTVVRRVALLAGVINTVTAMLAAQSNSPIMMMTAIGLAVVSFVVYVLIVDHSIR